VTEQSIPDYLTKEQAFKVFEALDAKARYVDAHIRDKDYVEPNLEAFL
jgi:hypothetical protein